MKSIDVVVVGGVHHNALGVIRSLGEAKIPKSRITAVLIGHNIPRFNIISASIYIDKEKVFRVESYEQALRLLVDISKDRKQRVIVCCSDGAAEIVMNNIELLKNYYKTPSLLINTDYMMSKDYQCEIAKQVGFNIPESSIVKVTDYHGEWTKFPCITKPIKSSLGAGKLDIHIANSQIELKQYLETIKSDYIQIQSYIKKKLEYQLIGCSLDDGKTILIPGYTDVIRQPFHTNTGYLRYSPINNFHYNKSAVEKFLKKIGYNGLFSMEFIRSIEGDDYFLEINMRNDGNAYCVKSAGVNLPYIWCYYQTYGRLPNVKYIIDQPIYFMPETTDLKYGIKDVGCFMWLRQLWQAESHAIINSKDIAPLFAKILSKIIT